MNNNNITIATFTLASLVFFVMAFNDFQNFGRMYLGGAIIMALLSFYWIVKAWLQGVSH